MRLSWFKDCFTYCWAAKRRHLYLPLVDLDREDDMGIRASTSYCESALGHGISTLSRSSQSSVVITVCLSLTVSECGDGTGPRCDKYVVLLVRTRSCDIGWIVDCRASRDHARAGRGFLGQIMATVWVTTLRLS